MNERDVEEIEEYGDLRIASYDRPVPRFLQCVYVVLPILGILAWIYFFNGSRGWFDRGAWEQLQSAAGTTFAWTQAQKAPEK